MSYNTFWRRFNYFWLWFRYFFCISSFFNRILWYISFRVSCKF